MFSVSRIIFFFCLILVFNCSCRKTESVISVPERGGIALTFDDYSVDNWHSYLYLFDSLHIKCTFYVSNFNKLTIHQKEKLHDIQKHGHEIAFHSTNHVNFLETMQSHGFKNLMEEEIKKGLELMNKEGFYPTNFAYPFGAHNLIMDKALLKKFKTVRVLNGTHELDNSLCSLSGNTIIKGLGIDESSKRSYIQICNLLSSASELDKCAVLLVHNIERHDTNLQMPITKLRKLLIKAKEMHLHFYTISEISR